MDLSEKPNGPFRRHPWELARRELFARILRQGGVLERGGKLLDVGSGDAWLSRWLVSDTGSPFDLTCWDSAFGETLRHGGVSYVRERPLERFSLVLMLDVLEHVDDDLAFLCDTVARNLSDDGHLLLSVPAWQRLYSQHDRSLDHKRRYQPSECRALLERAGLSTIRSGGAFHSLLLLRTAELAVQRLLGYKGRRPRELVWRRSELSRDVVTALLAVEARGSIALEQWGIRLPGLSWWALCRKTS